MTWVELLEERERWVKPEDLIWDVLYLHSDHGQRAVWVAKDTPKGCYVPCEILATAVLQ